MRDRIGQVFSGAITGVTEFGVFVELDEMPVDGLIHVSQLGNDYFLFEPEKMQLIGERTARQIRLGDAVEVIVASVDVDSDGSILYRTSKENRTQSIGEKTQVVSGRIGLKEPTGSLILDHDYKSRTADAVRCWRKNI
ncbi:MAG: hypothetical protein Ct9H300mP16_11790 [Pseudomonadota bacterium]|nr:MAG: hypothetical protein Ct9H300mP16_11790 [Pseudomonadota bacterium]